jgi:hypothetical protein
MGIVDTANGAGFLHAQTAELRGRKFWAWGNARQDDERMYFLSSCPGPDDASCRGSYLEMQAGVAPTQSQTFPLDARSSLEWTEAWAKWSEPPQAVSGPYSDAVQKAVASFVSSEEFEAVDAWLREMAKKPHGRVLLRGSAYGKLHEMLTQQKLSPALTFDSVDLDDPEWRGWHELLTIGTFSDSVLAEPAPRSFMVDLPWFARIHQSAEAHGWTWLHHLHAGIIQKQHGNNSSATKHFRLSEGMKPNVLASYCLGNLHQAWKLAETAIIASMGKEAFTVALGRDAAGVYADDLRKAARFADLLDLIRTIQAWPAALSPVATAILGSQALRIAEVAVVLYHRREPRAALDLLLDRRGWAVSTPDLVPMWYDAWYMIEHAKDALEQLHTRRKHPPPPIISFQGAT